MPCAMRKGLEHAWHIAAALMVNFFPSFHWGRSLVIAGPCLEAPTTHLLVQLLYSSTNFSEFLRISSVPGTGLGESFVVVSLNSRRKGERKPSPNPKLSVRW